VRRPELATYAPKLGKGEYNMTLENTYFKHSLLDVGKAALLHHFTHIGSPSSAETLFHVSRVS
jgi:hypothetical protein